MEEDGESGEPPGATAETSIELPTHEQLCYQKSQLAAPEAMVYTGSTGSNAMHWQP